MRIVYDGFKKGLSIFWDDSILLIIFNFVCFLALLPALLFYSVTIANRTILIAIINTVLVLPFVFFIFALYYVLFDCRRNIVIKIKTLFGYIRSTWKDALIFGVINLLFVLLVSWNLRFYAQFDEAWADVIQAAFLSISLGWAILQIIMLPMYPRLDEPSFKLALKNSAAIFAGYLIPVLMLVVWTILFVVLTVMFQALGMLFSFVFIAALAEGIIGEVVIDASPGT